MGAKKTGGKLIANRTAASPHAERTEIIRPGVGEKEVRSKKKKSLLDLIRCYLPPPLPLWPQAIGKIKKELLYYFS